MKSSLGITYDVLKERNPKLIMLSMPAFGNTGPYRNYRGYGANMEALMGHGLLRGYPDLDPTHNSSVLFSDAAAGALGSFAVMTALYQRHRTGKGQFIDLAQAEGVAQTYAQAYMDYAMNGRQQTTYGNRDVSRAPQGVYPSQGDDAWVTISCGDDTEFAALCRVMGQPDLAADKRFANSLERYKNQDELDPIISAWTATRTNIEAFHELQAAGVTAGPVLIQPDIVADPQLRHRDVWQEVTVKMTGTHSYLKPIIGRMSKTPLSIRRAAPYLGEDNEYVYRELLGYSARSTSGSSTTTTPATSSSSSANHRSKPPVGQYRGLKPSASASLKVSHDRRVRSDNLWRCARRLTLESTAMPLTARQRLLRRGDVFPGRTFAPALATRQPPVASSLASKGYIALGKARQTLTLATAHTRQGTARRLCEPAAAAKQPREAIRQTPRVSADFCRAENGRLLRRSRWLAEELGSHSANSVSSHRSFTLFK